MRTVLTLSLLAFSLPSILAASDFDNLVRQFSRQTGAQQTKIPFMGLTRFVVATARPKGTSEFKMAVFENVEGRQDGFAQSAEQVVQGSHWQRVIRTHSKSGESTNIYAQQDGKHLRMLIATVDNSDAVFIEMRITQERLVEFLDEHDGRRH